MFKLAWGGFIAALVTLMLPAVAEAHALAMSSDPADGASLDRPPSVISVSFSEVPDPKLSSVHVLNAFGEPLEKGAAEAMPGDTLTLRVQVGPLPNGVYTVNWRTVSAVDGHVAGGALAFGVGVSADEIVPTSAGTPAPSTPPPSPLGVAGRWTLYVGLALFVGAAWVGALALRHSSRALLGLAAGGGVISLAGLAALGESEHADAGVSWAVFLKTTLGTNLITQVVPIVAALLVLLASAALRGRWRRAAVVLALAFVAVALLLHALNSHAPSSRLPWLMTAAQFSHLAAFTVWIGGLAALIVVVRGAPSPLKAQAVRRFSRVAGIALGVVAVTGLLRAADEVGAVSKLLPTLFGQLVLVKAGLLGALVALGAVQRYRHVRAVARTLRGLRLAGAAELGVAAMLLVVAALLTSLAPPAFVRASTTASAPRVAADATDYGTTARIHLEAAPGYAGANRFRVAVVDYDTRNPVKADKVTLNFAVPSRRDVGESTLGLTSAPDGTWRGRGSNLSLEATWRIDVVVQKGADSIQVPMDLKVVTKPPVVSNGASGPTIYTVSLSSGRSMQAYVDPGRAGSNQVHVTFLDAKGAELPTAEGVTIKAVPATGSPVDLRVARFGEGHFIGEADLGPGIWRFEVTATAGDATPMSASFRESIRR